MKHGQRDLNEIDKLKKIADLAYDLAGIVQTQNKAPERVKRMASKIIEIGNELSLKVSQ